MSFIERLKSRRALHKLDESWNVEYQLMEEGYRDEVKRRGINPGQEVL